MAHAGLLSVGAEEQMPKQVTPKPLPIRRNNGCCAGGGLQAPAAGARKPSLDDALTTSENRTGRKGGCAMRETALC